MKNVLIIGLLFVIRCGFSQSTFDFRAVRWMNTSAVVSATEGKQKPIVAKDRLIYREVAAGGRIVGLEYNFDHDSLYSASYFYYTGDGVNRSDIIKAYTDFLSLLTEKYGKPASERKDIEGKETTWETRRTQINLIVANMGIQGWALQVQYLSTAWLKKANPKLIEQEAEKRKTQLKDF